MLTKHNMYNFLQHLKQITLKVSLFFNEIAAFPYIPIIIIIIIIREMIKLQNLIFLKI